MISEKIQNWAKIIGTIGIIGFYTMSTYLSTKENKEGIEKLELDIHKDFELRDSRSDKRHKRMNDDIKQFERKSLLLLKGFNDLENKVIKLETQLEIYEKLLFTPELQAK